MSAGNAKSVPCLSGYDRRVHDKKIVCDKLRGEQVENATQSCIFNLKKLFQMAVQFPPAVSGVNVVNSTARTENFLTERISMTDPYSHCYIVFRLSFHSS